jgi:methylenetetrahydromethanopterin dehydrogenase
MEIQPKHPVKVGVFKCGNIAISPLLELLLDELADRKDLKVRSITTGSKMDPADVEETLPKMLSFNPDIFVVISPNAALPGPAKAREIFANSGKPCIIVTDGPGKKVKSDLENQGIGYIVITGDPLIGARKEFLDPTEMALFNADISKVLAASGAFRIVQQEIDKVIYAVHVGTNPALPKLVIDLAYLRDNSVFANPYAQAKALAAYALAEKVAEINNTACFIEKDSAKYVLLAACAHEVAQAAAYLAQQAREIEKTNDTLTRKPHAKDGKIKNKTKLLSDPPFEE